MDFKAVINYLINSGLLLVCLIHVGFILISSLFPTLPQIKHYRKSLKDIQFPFLFRICVDEKNQQRYQDVGYINDWEYFMGKSMYNRSFFGWNGHTRNGSIVGTVAG